MHPIQVDGVVKTFSARRALDGISLQLRENEVLGLLGPNGAGKSTLVRTVMGRVTPDSGTVTIFGHTASPDDVVARQSVGVVPQEIALYPLLTARENLTVFGRYQGLSGTALEAAVSRALEWSGLLDRAGDVTKTFSGGMKRRLNLAAGILHGPRAILLDEPTVGVDPQSRERIYEMIGSLRTQGVSIVYTTHYMEEAERLCDRIAIIDHGRIIDAGTQQELVDRTIGAAREIVIDCEEQPLEPARAAFERRGAVVAGSRITLKAERAAEQMADILELAAAQQISIRDLAMRRPTLESVFLHLTGRDLRE